MSLSRRLFPYFVAALTGIASGIYIFKPILESQRLESLDGPLTNTNQIAGSEGAPAASSNTHEKSAERKLHGQTSSPSSETTSGKET